MDTKADIEVEEKKAYEAPEVKKLRLVSKDAVLATCHTSTINTPWIITGCKGYCAN